MVNGTHGRVTDTGPWGVKIEVTQGAERYLHDEYILKPRDRDGVRALEHAYCLTAHGMQDGTCEHSFTTAKPHELTAGFLYSTLSRAAERCELFVIIDQAGRDDERAEIAPRERLEPHTDREVLDRGVKRMGVRDNEDLAREGPGARPGPSTRPGRRAAVGPAPRAGPGSWPVAGARRRLRHRALTPHRARLMRRPSPIARHTASRSTPARASIARTRSASSRMSRISHTFGRSSTTGPSSNNS